MAWLSNILSALGSVVDKVVPVGVGSRTKFAVVVCALLNFAALCAAAPVFALAGLVRQ